MAAFGQLFPTPKISEVKGEPGDGQPPFRLGRIDLENGTVELIPPTRPEDGSAPDRD